MGQGADAIRQRDQVDDRDRALAPPSGSADEVEMEGMREGIEHTRAEMSETIDAIQQKLNPETLADQAKEAAREATEHAVDQAKEAVREATIGRAEDMVRTVTDTAQDMMQGAGETATDARHTLVETIKQNPLPVALTGLGLTWLWMHRERRPSSGSPLDRGGGGHAGSQVRPQGGGRSSSGQTWDQGWSGDAGGGRYPAAAGAGQDQRGVSETIERTKDAAGDLADQAQETIGNAADRVHGAARTAGDTASDVGSTLMAMIRQNPVPAALAGISLGWLWMHRPGASPGTAEQRSSYPPAAPPYGQPRRQGEGMVQQAQETAGQVVDQVQSTAGQVTSQAGEMAGQVADTAGQMAGRAQATVGQMVDEAQDRALRTRYRVEEVLQETPLVVGAVALALGAVAGVTVPQTRQEHRLMGEARDSLVEKAQAATQETLDRVQQVAAAAQTTAQQEARTQGLAQ